MNKKYSYIILGLVLLFFFNCKSTRVAGNTSNLNLSSKQLIKENAKQTPNFKTLQSKLKITYIEGEKSQTHSVNIRVKKDEVIWMSAALSIVKAQITPDKVSFYNKLDNTYFEGDFSYLSELLGTDLDFQKVQNLILGESLFDLNETPYKVSVDEGAYLLQPKEQQELFDLFLRIDASLFKIKSQEISQSKEFRNLVIEYLSHQEVGKQILPERIKVVAVEANEEAIINLEFKSVKLNEELRFPFKIPSGYTAIEL